MSQPRGNSIITHARVFRQLAEESATAAEVELAAQVVPFEEGRSGVVIRFDPEQRSFSRDFLSVETGSGH
jgi:hypothetical protein